MDPYSRAPRSPKGKGSSHPSISGSMQLVEDRSPTDEQVQLEIENINWITFTDILPW